MATTPPSAPRGGKRNDGGLMTSVKDAPASARRRLKEHQQAIKDTKRGQWRPAPHIHDFGEKFFSKLVGVKYRELKNKKGGTTDGYQLIFRYVADPDDDRAMKSDGKEWAGRYYRNTVYKDKDTGEERCIDFGYLKAYASMLSGEEVDDGETALETLIEAAKSSTIVEVRITERPNNQGGEPFAEEEILKAASSSESSSDDDDDDDDEPDTTVRQHPGGEGDDDDDDEEPAPPPEKKKKK